MIVLLGVGWVGASFGGSIEPIDLSRFAGKSQFDRYDGEWLLPRGRQVLNGVPFQIDGVIELYGRAATQGSLNMRTNVNDIPAGKQFEALHLLCAMAKTDADGTTVATLQLNYADGSSTKLALDYGRHSREFLGPRHEEDPALLDPRTREVWNAELTEAARRNRNIRLFHTVLTNPWPAKEVRSLSLESTRKQPALMVAAISLGPSNVTPLQDTLTLANAPPTGIATRTGEAVSVEGRIASHEGVPLSNALVKVTAARKLDTTDEASTVDNPAVGKQARTRADGRFTLPELADDLVYRLLAMADGFEAGFFYGADPRRGPIEVRLKPAKEIKPSRKHFVHGKVIGPDSAPVMGASVEPEGVGTDSSTSWGGTQNFPERVVTGLSGEFLMERQAPFTRLQLSITAPGLAPAKVWLPASNAVQTVKLGVGASVTGRVLHDGKPLAKVRVGVSGRDRNSEVYAGHYETGTDDSGRFTFQHLPPTTDWHLYGMIKSFKSYGSLSPRPIKSSNHGETTDVGDLEVAPGTTLAGQVQTRDGRPLPRNLGVWAACDTAWDSQLIKVDQDGRFEFTGLHRGLVDMSLDARDWQVAPINRSLDDINPWRLSGLLEQDKTDLLLVIENKPRDYNYRSSMANGQLPMQDRSDKRPLSGAETSGPPWILFAGKVADEKTGGTVRLVKITLGRKPPVGAAPPPANKPITQRLMEPFRASKPIPWNEMPYWDYSRVETFTNGQFSLAFIPLSSTPMFRVEADGYQPFETEPLTVGNTNLLIRLKKGDGPSGVVLLPNGKPAQGATIIFAAEREQFSLSSTGSLSAYGQKEFVQTTGADGRYSFAPRSTGQRLFASHAQGWADIALEQLPRNSAVELEPWAVATGSLVDTNGKPVANMKLSLNMRRDVRGNDAFVNLQEYPVTDAQGRFQFMRVPPGELNLVRIIPMTANSWTHKPQTRFIAIPGKTNELGKVILDQPPPPSVLEELKKKLGLQD